METITNKKVASAATTTIAHLTDVHMNFPTAITIGKFIKTCNNAIKEQNVDCFVLTGDISEAPHVVEHVRILRDFLEKPLYFVCGNHDFYNGSIEYVRAQLTETYGDMYLTSCTTTPNSLSDKVAIVGHDGWYDGVYANWHTSKLLMNDYHVIGELKPLYHMGLFNKIQDLAKEAAKHVTEQADKAIALGHKTIVIATHVPPFRENAVYNGKISDDDWMPHFSSGFMGQALLDLADKYPTIEFKTLCGHSHGRAEYHPKKNLECHTGIARYGEPNISKIHILKHNG